MDLPALIIELKSQMSIIRNATAIVEAIIAKLDAANVPAAGLKRKTDMELVPDAVKKQCIPPLPLLASSPVLAALSLCSTTANFQQDQSKTMQSQQTSTSGSSVGFENIGGFEFSAVKPKKRIFVSRLPLDITEDVLTRHIQNRLRNFDVPTEISILSKRRDATYSSALIHVGENEEIFRLVNRTDFWPPQTIVHQHRAKKPTHGFRSTKRDNWRRN